MTNGVVRGVTIEVGTGNVGISGLLTKEAACGCDGKSSISKSERKYPKTIVFYKKHEIRNICPFPDENVGTKGTEYD